MAATAKVTWFFKQLTSSQGWSESMYRQYVTDINSEVQVPAQLLALLRAACLSKDSRLLYLRVSDLANPRKVVVTDYEAPVVAPVGTWDGAYAFNCYLLRATSAARTLRPWFFRDVPAAFADETAAPNVADPFWTSFNAWKDSIETDGNWLLQTIDNALNLNQSILAVGPSANGNILITPPVAQYGVGTDVIVSKIKTFPQFNRRWRIGATGAGLTMVLANSTWPPGEVAIAGEGRIARVAYKYEAITSITTERISHRKAGRPFGLPVGRARPRR
jgi:hypothetical protein